MDDCSASRETAATAHGAAHNNNKTAFAQLTAHEYIAACLPQTSGESDRDKLPENEHASASAGSPLPPGEG
jgi:hypothetical protein